MKTPSLSVPVAVDELCGTPCPMCGTLVRQAVQDEAGLVTVAPCGCRI